MKKILYSILLTLFTLSVFADDNVVLFYINDGSIKGFYKEEIDSIAYSHYDVDSLWHENYVVQEIWSNDSVCRIPLCTIDSICHSVPKPVYQEGVIKLDDRYLPYITSSDGHNISFSPNMPDYLRPKKGDVLLYEGSSELFPDGFAGKVSNDSGMTLSCDSVGLADVYQEVVFVGRYAIAEQQDGGESKYRAQKVRRKNLWDDMLDDFEEYHIGEYDGSADLPTIKMGAKIEFKKSNITVAASENIKTSMFIEFRYSANVYCPLLYSKVTTKVTEERSAKISYGFLDEKPDADKSFWEEDVKWYQYVVPDDGSSKTKLDQIVIINKSVPIPEMPLLSLGFKLGAFLEPKLSGEISYSVKGKLEKEYTVIYNLTPDNFPGTVQHGKGPETFEVTHKVEGDVKGSLWTGIVLAANLGFGVEGKGAKAKDFLKEEVTIKVGPYAELDANLNISEGVINKSWYSALHDSKFKVGLKAGLDLSLSAEAFGKKATWNQFSVEDPKLTFERNLYLLPDFTQPTYTRNGNSVSCTSKLSRNCFPAAVGFRLYNENGLVDTKFKDNWYFAETGGEFSIGETFTGLDFVNHSYRIVPVMKIFGALGPIEIPAPNQSYVTCPDSNHPHLIDLGLPSGAKWQCCNLYADQPTDAGGYYQWGAPYMVTSLSSSYTFPSFEGANYQGTAYDAATANRGKEYFTPTRKDFDELMNSCRHTIEESNWGFANYGMHFKANNGNELYLPFAGYKKALEAETSSTGYYVLADKVADGGVNNPVLMIGESTYQCTPASWYAYSVRPVSLPEVIESKPAVQISTTELNFGDIMVGESKTLTFTVTNVTNENVVVGLDLEDEKQFIADTYKFTLAPNATRTVSVTFCPNEVKEYKLDFGILYGKMTKDDVLYFTLKGKGINSEHGSATTHEYVDLGLPSGTLWATCNVGASSPEEYGDYFAWGETSPKEVYDKGNYKWYNGNNYFKYNSYDNMSILELDDDVAHIRWGDKWRMPTNEERKELLDLCTFEVETLNGVKGRKIIGPNGNYIFMPGAGYRSDNEKRGVGIMGLYWTCSIHDYYDFYAREIRFSTSENHYITGEPLRYLGMPIRPVYGDLEREVRITDIVLENTSFNLKIGEKCKVNYVILPSNVTNSELEWWCSNNDVIKIVDGTIIAIGEGTCTLELLSTDYSHVEAECCITVTRTIAYNNNYEWVDLGLPSGTKWATFNVGATCPKDYGGYYRWGETEDSDCLSEYKWKADTLGFDGDVASVKWGNNWRIPTKDELEELFEYCVWTRSDIEGIEGYNVVGSNGNSIFLPAAGRYTSSGCQQGNKYSFYMSSSLDESSKSFAYSWVDGRLGAYSRRSCAHSVRPVFVPSIRTQGGDGGESQGQGNNNNPSDGNHGTSGGTTSDDNPLGI